MTAIVDLRGKRVEPAQWGRVGTAYDPHAAVVVDDGDAKLAVAAGIVVDGFVVGTDVQVVVDFAAVVDGAKNPRGRSVADLEDVKRERTTALQAAIRAYVDAGLPPSEREALAALLQRTTLMRLMGVAVDEGASFALVAALGWAEAAMVAGSEAAARVDACTSVDEVAAVGVDVDTIGPPPRITAGEVAARLRGAE